MGRAVGAIIEHPKHGMLFQLRDENTSKYPLHWSLFGGRVEEGESDEEALYRELYEEVSLKRSMMKNVRRVKTYHHEGVTQILYHVMIEISPDELVLGEGKDMKFVKDIDMALKELNFAYNIKEVLIDYMGYKNN